MNPARIPRSAYRLAQARAASTANWRIRQWGSDSPVRRAPSRAPVVKAAMDAQVRAVLSTIPPQHRREFLRHYRENVKLLLKKLDRAQSRYENYASVLQDPASLLRASSLRAFRADLKKFMNPHEVAALIKKLVEEKKIAPVTLIPVSPAHQREIQAEIEKVRPILFSFLKRKGIRDPVSVYDALLSPLSLRVAGFDPSRSPSMRAFIIYSFKKVFSEYYRAEFGRSGKRRMVSLDAIGSEFADKKYGRLSRMDPVDVRVPLERNRAEWAAVLEQSMKRLPVQQRLALHLAYVEGLTTREVAKRMGVKQPRVVKILLAARDRLRTLLEGYRDDPSL